MLTSAFSSRGSRLISILLNGVKTELTNDESLKELCQRKHVQMSSFCKFGETSDCSLCKVIVDGKLTSPCTCDLRDGSVVITNSEELKEINKKQMLEKTPIPETFFNNNHIKDNSHRAIQLDPMKCKEGCTQCIDVCTKNALVLNPRVQAFGNASLQNSGCTSCGMCASACKENAISYKFNTELFDEVMENEKENVKVAVIDSLILEKVNSILNEKMTFDDMSMILHSLGFDYIMDTGVCRDYSVVMDAARIYQQMKKGEEATASTFCPSVQKSLFTMPVIQPHSIAEVLLPKDNIVTFVFTHCPTLVSEYTIAFNDGKNKVHRSVAFSPQELAEIIKKNRNKKLDKKCKTIGYSSNESLSTVSAEAYANAVVYCFAKQYLNKCIPTLEFKDFDKETKLAEVDFGGKTKAFVAIVKGAKGVDRIHESGIENVLYIVAQECESCGSFFDVDTSKEMHSEVTRKVKRVSENALAMNLYNKFLDEEMHEKFVNEPDTYF